ncbi:MAG: DUF2628 domain-containing protein [Alphaproteobacteria bacterium]|nr:MAG: DUF2628 domain-containing protein [Alphaproteobacteria bacterium]
MNNDKDVFHFVKSEPSETLKKPKKSTNYYLKSFKKMQSGQWTFNFAAFCFGMFWLLYRRMYVYALCHFIISMYVPLPFTLMSMAFGFFANRLYFHHLQSKYIDGEKTSGVNHWVIPFTIICIFLMNFQFMHMEERQIDPLSYRNIKL